MPAGTVIAISRRDRRPANFADGGLRKPAGRGLEPRPGGKGEEVSRARLGLNEQRQVPNPLAAARIRVEQGNLGRRTVQELKIDVVENAKPVRRRILLPAEPDARGDGQGNVVPEPSGARVVLPAAREIHLISAPAAVRGHRRGSREVSREELDPALEGCPRGKTIVERDRAVCEPTLDDARRADDEAVGRGHEGAGSGRVERRSGRLQGGRIERGVVLLFENAERFESVASDLVGKRKSPGRVVPVLGVGHVLGVPDEPIGGDAREISRTAGSERSAQARLSLDVSPEMLGRGDLSLPLISRQPLALEVSVRVREIRSRVELGLPPAGNERDDDAGGGDLRVVRVDEIADRSESPHVGIDQGDAAGVRIGQVDGADRKRVLRPSRSESAEVGRRHASKPSHVDAAGDDARNLGLERGPDVPGARKIEIVGKFLRERDGGREEDRESQNRNCRVVPHSRRHRTTRMQPL